MIQTLNLYKTLFRSLTICGAEVWVLNSKFKPKLKSKEWIFSEGLLDAQKLDKVRNEETRARKEYHNSTVDCINSKQLL